MKRKLQYFGLNAVYLASAIAGFFFDVVEAANLAVFLAWFRFFGGLLFFCMGKVCENWDTVTDAAAPEDKSQAADGLDSFYKLKKKGRAVSDEADMGFDLICACVFAAGGHWFLATLILMGQFLGLIGWNHIRALPERENPELEA